MSGFVWAGILLIALHIFINSTGLAMAFCSVYECIKSGFPTDYVFGVFFIGIGLYSDHQNKKQLP